MQAALVKISDLRPNPSNPRLIKDDKFKKLVKSVKEFPEMLQLRPIVYDADGIILGGNMRFEAQKAAGYCEVWAVCADALTEAQKREFIIKDNVGFGEWDHDALANEWDANLLVDWGMDLPVFVNSDEYSEGFNLPEGDKPPFRQITFTLANAQADEIDAAILKAKNSPTFEYVENFGNENGNGNALFLIVQEWVAQKK